MKKTFTSILTILILTTLTIFGLSSCGQTKSDWTQLTSFQIYDYKTFPQDKDIKTYSDIDIQQMNFIETNLAETKKILNKAKPLNDEIYLWKGYHFAIATFADGQKRRIKISVYGDFFMDLTNNMHYEFQGQAREEWDKFWTDNYNELHKIN